MGAVGKKLKFRFRCKAVEQTYSRAEQDGQKGDGDLVNREHGIKSQFTVVVKKGSTTRVIRDLTSRM